MQLTGPIFPNNSSGIPNYLFITATRAIPIGVFSLFAGAAPPPPVGNALLMEDNTNSILLEDNTNELLLEA